MTSWQEKFSFSRLVLALIMALVLVMPNVSWGQATASSNEACLEGKSSKESIAAAETKRKAQEEKECAERAKKMNVLCPDGVTFQKRYKCNVEAKCKLQGESCESIRNKIKAAEKARDAAYNAWKKIGDRISDAEAAAKAAEDALAKATDAWKNTPAYKKAKQKADDADVASLLADIALNTANDALDAAISETPAGRFAIGERQNAENAVRAYEDYAQRAYEKAQIAKAPGATKDDIESAKRAAERAQTASKEMEKKTRDASSQINKAIKNNSKAKKATKAVRDAKKKADKAKQDLKKAEKDLEDSKPSSLKNTEKKTKAARDKADKLKAALQKQLDDARKKLDDMEKKLKDFKNNLNSAISCQVSAELILTEQNACPPPPGAPEEPKQLKQPQKPLKPAIKGQKLQTGNVFSIAGQQFSLPTNINYKVYTPGVETKPSSKAGKPIEDILPDSFIYTGKPTTPTAGVPMGPVPEIIGPTPVPPITPDVFELEGEIWTTTPTPTLSPFTGGGIGAPLIGAPRVGGGLLR